MNELAVSPSMSDLECSCLGNTGQKKNSAWARLVVRAEEHLWMETQDIFEISQFELCEYISY